MSYDMTWEYLHRLIAEMNAEGKINLVTGYGLLIISMYNHVKHKREGQYIKKLS